MPTLRVYRSPRSAPGRPGRSRASAEQRRQIEGLQDMVEILRDRWGVPHIYAQNLDDLLFAQGYVHAEDRLWQMEMNRRIGHGRLAEVLGRRGVASDRLLRTLGFGRAAAAGLAALDAATSRLLSSYAEGVNAGVTSLAGRLPLEFRLLRFRPEPWQPVDSLAWGKVLAWVLSINWGSEILRAALVQRLGAERAAYLEPDPAAGHPLVLPEQEPAATAHRLLAEFQAAAPWLPAAGLTGMSNNWVIDGTRSKTGHPLLANDPHLTAFLPSIWYENHLSAPDWQVAGVSVPGAPGVVIGHNADIAWGMTAAFADTQDLYLEKFHAADPQLYEYEGSWAPAQLLAEEIYVRRESQPEVAQVVLTRHGPIISGVVRAVAEPNTARVALRWSGHEPSCLPRAVLALNRASDWASFRAALADWHEPVLNFVYADRQGNIGYQMAGRVPRRARGLGLVPAPGWTAEFDWLGWIPFEELPNGFNPEQHYFATANNQVVGQDYPHFLSTEMLKGFRAQRIVEMLDARALHSAEDFARLQTDQYCGHVARPFCRLLVELAPRIAAHPALRPVRELAWAALGTLDDWDYYLTADTIGGALYEVILHFTMQRTFKPWLGDLTDHYLGAGVEPLLSPVLFAFQEAAPLALLRILTEGAQEWLVDENRKSVALEDVLAPALADAIAYLTEHLGPHLAGWRWGDLHQIQFHHPLGTLRPLARILNRGPYAYGGDHATVWQGGFPRQLPIPADSAITASWRQIIDAGNWDASLGILPPGQSGRPGSRHYDDLIIPWLEGRYHPLLWSRALVEAAAEARLVLQPGAGLPQPGQHPGRQNNRRNGERRKLK